MGKPYIAQSMLAVSRLHQPELVSITDKTARHRRLVELNVMEQCLNLLKNGIVQSHVQRYGYPHVHAAVYDKSTGLIKVGSRHLHCRSDWCFPTLKAC